MEVTENILLERQRYLINLLIENTKKLNKVKNIHINSIIGKDELTDVSFNIIFSKQIQVKDEPTIKPETEKLKSVLNFDSIEDKIAQEKKVIEDYIEKVIENKFITETEFVNKIANKLWASTLKETPKVKDTVVEKKLTDLNYLKGFEWLKFADEVTPEYIDNLHKQIIEKNKETSKNIETKQHKVVLAIFDLSDMD